MLTLDPEKRKRALELLRHGHASRLLPDDQIVYTIALMMSDGEQPVDRAELEAAAADPAARSAARELLRRACS